MAAMKGDFRKQQATPYHMNPNVPYIKNTKPFANDLLRELLAAPGGLDKMNQQQQYGKGSATFSLHLLGVGRPMCQSHRRQHRKNQQ